MWLESFKIALGVLRSHKLRTALTALSVALGAGAIALMVSLSKSGMSTISAGIDAVGGRNIIFLVPGDAKSGQGKNYDLGITSQDAAAVKRRVPGLQAVAFPMVVKGQFVVAAGKRVELDIGVGASLREYMNQAILVGSDIPRDDDKQSPRVTVISEAIAHELFGTPEAAIGQSLVIWSHRYRIIGVTSAHGQKGLRLQGMSYERYALFPLQAMIQSEGLVDRGYAILRSDGTVSHDLIMRLTNAVMLNRHRLDHDFEFFDLQAMIAKFDMIFIGLRLLTGLIASVSLLIAGAGVMNVLLASVRQRIVEIGIRRALGASQEDIRRQFVVESMTVAGLGGLLGSVGGLMLALLIGLIVHHFESDWITSLSWGAAVLAVLFSVVIGFLFGLRPARQAAALDVVNCLNGGDA